VQLLLVFLLPEGLFPRLRLQDADEDWVRFIEGIAPAAIASSGDQELVAIPTRNGFKV
jgi:hypothetical protein